MFEIIFWKSEQKFSKLTMPKVCSMVPLEDFSNIFIVCQWPAMKICKKTKKCKDKTLLKSVQVMVCLHIFIVGQWHAMKISKKSAGGTIERTLGMVSFEIFHCWPIAYNENI